MPKTKGAKHTTKRQQAEILALKNVQNLPTREIGAKVGVSHATVVNIKPETVSPEVRALAKEYEVELQRHIRAGAFKAVKRTIAGIDELPADKSAKVAEIFFNMDRTIEEKSTTRTSQLTNEQKAVGVLLKLLEKNIDKAVVIPLLCERYDVEAEILESVEIEN